MRYVAFLRGINVGGHKIIKMEDLSKILESLGFKNVKTYIQSGNVLFDTSEKATNSLEKKIKAELNDKLGYEVEILLQTMVQIQGIVKQKPFKNVRLSGDVKTYVTFLSSNPPKKLKFPITSKNKDVEVFSIIDNVAFCLSHKIKGKFGFPNIFIEKEFKVPATTRNWTTIEKIAALN